MNQYLEILMRCPLFAQISKDALPRLLRCLDATVEHVDKKATILEEGGPATSVGILLTGTAQIMQVDYYGNRSILFRLVPGDVFSETFACAEIRSVPVAVVANEPCDVMLIDSRHILHTCSKHCEFHHQLIFNLVRDLAQKAILFHQKIEVTSKRTTREKLMTYLTQQANALGTTDFEIPFDRQELADYLEVDRSGLSAEIGKMKREGILESQRHHFVLL